MDPQRQSEGQLRGKRSRAVHWSVVIGYLMLVAACAPTQQTAPPAPAAPDTAPASALEIADFRATPSTGSTPLTTTFSWTVDSAGGGAVSCEIDVDANGAVEYRIADCSTTSQQTHTYGQAGDWVPMLTATNERGDSAMAHASVFTVDESVTLTVELLGSNHAPPIDTPGSGVVVVNVDAGVLTLAGNFSGLAGNATASHIHVGAEGENGPIEIPLDLSLAEGDPTSGALSVTHTLTEQQAQMLRSGNLYVNVHSSAFPSGELRGQIPGAQ